MLFTKEVMATATVIMAMVMAMGDRIILLPANAKRTLPLVDSKRKIA
jgi:hypothetical protein